MYEIYWEPCDTGMLNCCKCPSLLDAQILWDILAASPDKIILLCLRP